MSELEDMVCVTLSHKHISNRLDGKEKKKVRVRKVQAKVLCRLRKKTLGVVCEEFAHLPPPSKVWSFPTVSQASASGRISPPRRKNITQTESTNPETIAAYHQDDPEPKPESAPEAEPRPRPDPEFDLVGLFLPPCGFSPSTRSFPSSPNAS